MSKFKFKVGDKVTIAKSSRYYGDSDNPGLSNPRDTEGSVIEVRQDRRLDEFPYRVEWTNGQNNTYDESDLVFYKEGLTVPEDFVKAAHAAACGDWKLKIEAQFPDLFPNENFRLTEEGKTPAHNILYYYCSESNGYVPLRGVSLANGITMSGNDYGLNEKAKFRALYIDETITRGYEVAVINKSNNNLGAAVTFTKKKRK